MGTCCYGNGNMIVTNKSGVSTELFVLDIMRDFSNLTAFNNDGSIAWTKKCRSIKQVIREVKRRQK